MPRLRPTRPSSLAASASILMASGALGTDFSSSSNVAVYWGQNSYGQSTGPLSQQNLATYCADTDVDIIPLAFMIQMTGGYNTRTNTTVNAYTASNETLKMNQTITKSDAGEQRMVVNFANAGNNCSIFSGTGLLDCGETIGQDIKTCQVKYGKTILLSIGGATYTEGGFADEDAAVAAAEAVWKTFGPANDGSTSTNSTAAGQEDIVTTTVIASNADATTTMTLTFTEGANFPTSALTTPGPSNPTDTASVVMSGALPLLTTSLSVAQNVGGGGLVFATDTTATDTYSGPALSSATATSTGNPDMDTNTIPTVNPTAAEETSATDTYSGPALSSATATSTGNDDMDTSTIPTVNPTDLQVPASSSKALPGSTSTVAVSSFASVAEVSSHQTRRQAAGLLRPFGDAVIDGFDIDLESSTQNFLPFVRRLRELMDGDDARSYYMTAAPQCPYPDAAVSQLLDSDVRFDAVFVQFYNNFCGVQSFTAGSATQTNFNFETWDTWAKNASTRWASSPARNMTGNKRQASRPANVKVFLGVPGGVTGAGSGYVPLEQLKPVVEYSKQFESFGGVMMWDVSQAKANDGFLPGVKALLGGAAAPGTTSLAAFPMTSVPGATSSIALVASSSASEVLITSSPAQASPTDAVASSTGSLSTSQCLSSLTDLAASPTDSLAPSTPASSPVSSGDGLTCSCGAAGVTVTITAIPSATASSSVSGAVLTLTASETLTSETAGVSSTDDQEANEIPSPSGDLISSVFPTGRDAASPTGTGASTLSSDSSHSSDGTRNPGSATASKASRSFVGASDLSALKVPSPTETLPLSTTSSPTSSEWDLDSSIATSGFETSTTTSAELPSPRESFTSRTQSSDEAPTATPASATSTNVPTLRSRIVRSRMRMSWRG